jgi:hypothetical protein
MVGRNMSCAIVCALVCAGASYADLDFRYDTTYGTEMNYVGGLDAGVLSFDSVPGITYRVQLVGGDVALGTFGVGGASLEADVEFLTFNDLQDVGYGQGDLAEFQGMPNDPLNLEIMDEFGNSMVATIDYMQLYDATSSPYAPGIQGQASLVNVEFSGPTFQGIDISPDLDAGFMYVFIEQGNWGTMGALLDGGGSAPVYTMEISLIPAPGTLIGLGAMTGLIARRRR